MLWFDKHLETKTLGVQDQVTDNPADVVTKCICGDSIETLLHRLGSVTFQCHFPH